MAKASQPKMPSKAEMAKSDRHYRAESMAKDAMCNTPQYKSAVRVAERQLAKVEATVKSAVAPKKSDKK